MTERTTRVEKIPLVGGWTSKFHGRSRFRSREASIPFGSRSKPSLGTASRKQSGRRPLKILLRIVCHFTSERSRGERGQGTSERESAFVARRRTSMFPTRCYIMAHRRIPAPLLGSTDASLSSTSSSFFLPVLLLRLLRLHLRFSFQLGPQS